MATPSQYKKVIQLFQTDQTAKTTCTACFKGTRIDYLGQFLTDKGCCGSCKMSGGYLDRHYNAKEIKQIKKDFHFDNSKDGKGFLGLQGCKLPYNIRSGVCIGYTCGRLYERLSDSGVNKTLLNDKHDVWIDKTKRVYKPIK